MVFIGCVLYNLELVGSYRKILRLFFRLVPVCMRKMRAKDWKNFIFEQTPIKISNNCLNFYWNIIFMQNSSSTATNLILKFPTTSPRSHYQHSYERFQKCAKFSTPKKCIFNEPTNNLWKRQKFRQNFPPKCVCSVPMIQLDILPENQLRANAISGIKSFCSCADQFASWLHFFGLIERKLKRSTSYAFAKLNNPSHIQLYFI